MERIKKTWYAAEGSRWAELLTVLHLPYTGMVLCYVALGAFFAPAVHWDRLAWCLLAYFLGLGVGAHALDELSGRPYGRSFKERELWVIGGATLLLASLIGVYYAVTLSPWLWLFVALGAFFAVTYPLGHLLRGRFHTDFWFVVSWGMLPFLTSYFLQTLTLTFSSLLMAGALGGTAAIEITLSRWVRALRKRPARLRVMYADGSEEGWEFWQLVGKPERALKLLVATVYLFTAAVGVWRLL
ncbi:MAG TPA: hypothetical protein VJO34_15120 [Methylomirabilota bacterium]|nr:hypothetical protein [Methylomirabilota bacterium]